MTSVFKSAVPIAFIELATTVLRSEGASAAHTVRKAAADTGAAVPINFYNMSNLQKASPLCALLVKNGLCKRRTANGVCYIGSTPEGKPR